jgi:hypothetical protein
VKDRDYQSTVNGFFRHLSPKRGEMKLRVVPTGPLKARGGQRESYPPFSFIATDAQFKGQAKSGLPRRSVFRNES